MIKFFRNIRKKLLTENKFSRYLIYAIGEIILVVIGILIALQINTWKEEKAARAFERKILLDIKSSLKGNLWQLNNAIQCNQKVRDAALLILENLKGETSFHDSLGVHFSDAISWCVPTLNNAGYESLKSYGIHTITNDTIREQLSVYEAGWMETLGQRQENYFFNTASPILTELFESVAMRTSMKPYNYEALKNSRAYRSILKTSIAYREDQIRWYMEWKIHLEDLERLIDTELGIS